MFTKYSKIYPSKREKRYKYRYDYENNMLEYITRQDCYINDSGNLINLCFINWLVVRSIRLCLDDWELSPEYWVDYYSGEINEDFYVFEYKRGKRWGIPKLRIVG